VDAPAVGERFDEKQSAAAELVSSPHADLVLEPAALIDDFPANDSTVELKAKDDLATPVY
jgi:hypothetical protein